jgi:hypothetical protein
LSYRGHSKGSYGSQNHSRRSWFGSRKKKQAINQSREQGPLQDSEAWKSPESIQLSNQQQPFANSFELWVHKGLGLETNGFDVRVNSIEDQGLARQLSALAVSNKKIELQLKTANDPHVLKRFILKPVRDVPQDDLVQILQQGKFYFGNLSDDLNRFGYSIIPVSGR